MSLLNNTKPAQPQAEAPKAPVAETVATEGKKKHSNSEYQKKQRELTRQHGKTVLEFIKTLKDVPADVKEAAEWLGRDVGTRSSGMHASAFGKPVFYQLFGDTPKVGDSITALEVFNKTDKGYSDMRQLMKKWKEKQGITVELDEKTKTYIIKDGKIPAYQA